MLALALSLLGVAGAAPTDPCPRGQGEWKLSTTFKGNDFYDKWNWETFDDPTHGRVNYLDLETAQNNHLTWVADDGQFGMAADSEKVVKSGERGRDSIRISSQEQFGDSIIVLDMAHMPVGCGTWPAFWMMGEQPWPKGGEIDIIEGGCGCPETSMVTMHSFDSGCQMAPDRGGYSGNPLRGDCHYGPGCNVGTAPSPSYFGTGANAAGGGWYVARRNEKGYAVWHYPRNADPSTIPDAVKNGGDTIDESTLGTKIADFPNTNCDFRKYFSKDMNLIINLTMCGALGTQNWAGAGCPADITCEAFVDANPGNFTDAYWLINSIRIYT